MSGTLRIKFVKGEISKVKKVFHLLSSDGTNLFPPDKKYIPDNSKNRGLYVEFKKGIMSLDYAIWDQYSSGWATIIAQELLKYFEAEKAGWDSVGWCKSLDEFKNSGAIAHKHMGKFYSMILSKIPISCVYIEYDMRGIASKLVKDAVDKLKNEGEI